MIVTALQCPTCGAPLAVATDADSLRCDFCRTAHRVERSAGHVELQPLADQMDRIAAELAVARLVKQLADQRAELDSARTADYAPAGAIERSLPRIVGGALLASFALMLVWPYAAILFVLLLIVPFVLPNVLHNRRVRRAIAERSARLNEISAAIDNTRAELDKARAVIDSHQ